MTKEKVIAWEPIEDITPKLYFKSLSEYQGKLIIHLVPGKCDSLLSITFSNAIAYRTVDEGDRLKIVNDAEGFHAWPLYTVANSEFLAWFHKESYDVREGQGQQHYLICTADNMIDVLALEKPTVTWEQDE